MTAMYSSPRSANPFYKVADPVRAIDLAERAINRTDHSQVIWGNKIYLDLSEVRPTIFNQAVDYLINDCEYTIDSSVD